MKLPYLAPALLLHALLAPWALAQTVVTSLPGNVSTMNINLTVNETIGGWKIGAAKKTADAAKGIDYPDTIRYDAVFFPSNPASAILNPFGWSDPSTNNYVEKVTSKTPPGGTLTVTAEGSNVINQARYTNATLLAELVAAGKISSVQGYRLVAVRFDTVTDGNDVFDNSARGYLTLVKPGLYFFAERGPNDAAPVYLGAEDNVYDFPQIIDFASFETAQAGKYKDVFTGRTEEQGGGFAYTLVSDDFNGISLAEFAIYRRPAGSANYHELRAGGVFNWKETYDNKAGRNTYNRGAVTGVNLTGPATLYSSPETALTANSGIVRGGITLPAATYQSSLLKYMLQIPPIKAD